MSSVNWMIAKEGSVSNVTQRTQNPVSPSPKQMQTFSFAIDCFKSSDAVIVAEMDEEDSTMVISVTDDGLTTHARFDVAGNIIGDWF